MNIHLTFDIEVWCNGWNNLDREFATCYPRYVYGRSRHGDYALPKTLEILGKHGLKGVFFVEPLFSARFGQEYLERIVRMIDDAGQEVQLHLHPEWTDEIKPPILPDTSRKRQHLTYYSFDEQVELIRYSKALLESSLGKPVTTFRSGSYAANTDTFKALAHNSISIDYSINGCYSISAPEMVQQYGSSSPFSAHGVTTFPVSIFRDGFGRMRPAQVGACSYQEMRQAITSAHDAGWTDFVIVSHNFEMLKQGTAKPDLIVASRFEALCKFLGEHKVEFPTTGLSYSTEPQDLQGAKQLRVGFISTSWRLIEQVARKVM